MMTVITLNKPTSLNFANSESKAVGAGGSMINRFVKEHAPQIVGGLHLAANSAIFLTANPFAMASAVVGMTGKLIMIGYGTKENQHRMAASGKEQNGQHHGLFGQLEKVANPKAYPIESASGMSAISSAMMIGYGLSGGGLIPIISEVLSLAASIFLITGEEKKEGQEKTPCGSVLFAHSNSNALAWCGKELQMLKDNPVFTSSMVNTVINLGTMIGGAVTGNPYLAVAGALFAASTITQAAYIKKSDYNIEGAEQAASEPAETTFVQREMARRSQASGQQRVA